MTAFLVFCILGLELNLKWQVGFGMIRKGGNDILVRRRLFQQDTVRTKLQKSFIYKQLGLVQVNIVSESWNDVPDHRRPKCLAKVLNCILQTFKEL